MRSARVSTTLPNGIRLIVQPETISDTVKLYGRIKTNQDLQAPKGEEGVASVFPFGTTSMNHRLQLQQALDEISARESAGLHFSLAVPSAHFAEASSCSPATNCTRHCRRAPSRWCSTRSRGSWPASCSRRRS